MLAKLKTIVAVTGFYAAFASAAAAASFSYTGSINGDDGVGLIYFTVDSMSSVTLQTFSYAGGTQADGNVVSSGGFDTILSLFDSTGLLISANDDGSMPPVGVDPATGSSFDSSMELLLGAGTYTVAVTQYDNFAAGLNLSDGFTEAGNLAFTSGYGCSNGVFCDINGDNRTADWAMDVTIAAVPVPASLPFLVLGLGALAALRRRKRT